ncbi:type II toxin-antitoxin system death-on-curing family toxin [Sphingomonas solaris]|uniref:Type II toxin-antitoxin system death-on-curing family toxin n=1 Tax=Alterirhizorhabdus solaris TaxID=2529389 RepID=A0A558QWN6_9SPHN|nr:type II toxin-antitoxin system death-on-curing family toxin [Sphingomonas solaris]
MRQLLRQRRLRCRLIGNRSRPHAGIGTVDKYQSVFSKSAALFHSLIKNHPFHNGNKRAAVCSLLAALYRNDLIFIGDVTDDTIYDLSLNVAGNIYPCEKSPLAGDDLINALADWIGENTERIAVVSSGMRVQDFLDRCKDAGCTVRKGKGGKWVISNSNLGGVSISQSTPQIDGNVVRNYLQKLKLSPSTSGIFQSQFETGLGEEQEQIRRYMVALRRLART